MCFEGECRHKHTIKKKSASKSVVINPIVEKPSLKEIPLPRPKHKDIKVNRDQYEEVEGIERKHFLRSKTNKLMFYTGRGDLPFYHLNLAKEYTLRHANYLNNELKLNCEPITLSELRKELKISRTLLPLKTF